MKTAEGILPNRHSGKCTCMHARTRTYAHTHTTLLQTQGETGPITLNSEAKQERLSEKRMKHL